MGFDIDPREGEDLLDELRKPDPLVNETVDFKTLFKIDSINKEDEYRFDEHAEAVAAERGQVVVYPNPNQLQIDIDSPEALKEFYKRCYALDQFFIDAGGFEADQYDKIEVKMSRTEGHHHIYLTFMRRTFTEYERILWQSMLGSDPAREFLNFRRLLFGIERPSRMFETPLVNEKCQNESSTPGQ